jgi:hypothetical protein
VRCAANDGRHACISMIGSDDVRHVLHQHAETARAPKLLRAGACTLAHARTRQAVCGGGAAAPPPPPPTHTPDAKPVSRCRVSCEAMAMAFRFTPSCTASCGPSNTHWQQGAGRRAARCHVCVSATRAVLADAQAVPGSVPCGRGCGACARSEVGVAMLPHLRPGTPTARPLPTQPPAHTRGAAGTRAAADGGTCQLAARVKLLGCVCVCCSCRRCCVVPCSPCSSCCCWCWCCCSCCRNNPCCCHSRVRAHNLPCACPLAGRLASQPGRAAGRGCRAPWSWPQLTWARPAQPLCPRQSRARRLPTADQRCAQRSRGQWDACASPGGAKASSPLPAHLARCCCLAARRGA